MIIGGDFLCETNWNGLSEESQGSGVFGEFPPLLLAEVLLITSVYCQEVLNANISENEQGDCKPARIL